MSITIAPNRWPGFQGLYYRNGNFVYIINYRVYSGSNLHRYSLLDTNVDEVIRDWELIPSFNVDPHSSQILAVNSDSQRMFFQQSNGRFIELLRRQGRHYTSLQVQILKIPLPNGINMGEVFQELTLEPIDEDIIDQVNGLTVPINTQQISDLLNNGSQRSRLTENENPIIPISQQSPMILILAALIPRWTEGARNAGNHTYWQLRNPSNLLRLADAPNFVREFYPNAQEGDRFIYWPDLLVAGTINDIVNTLSLSGVNRFETNGDLYRLSNGRFGQPVGTSMDLTGDNVYANSLDPLNPEHERFIESITRPSNSLIETTLTEESYETLLKQLYSLPVTLPEYLIVNDLKINFIPFEQLNTIQIEKYNIDPLLQPWAGPPKIQNRIITIFDTNGMTYLVKARYDQVNSQIYPPI